MEENRVASVEAIQTGEKDLMDSITAELDWGVLGEIIRNRHQLEISDNLEFSGGNIIVHENQVAYQLNFDVTVRLSVTLDRDGQCIIMEIPLSSGKEDAPETDVREAVIPEAVVPEVAAPESVAPEPAQPENAGPVDDAISDLPDLAEITEEAPLEVESDPLAGLPDPKEMTESALDAAL